MDYFSIASQKSYPQAALSSIITLASEKLFQFKKKYFLLASSSEEICLCGDIKIK